MTIPQYLRLLKKYKQYNSNLTRCWRTNNNRRGLYWSHQLSKLQDKMMEYRNRPWYNDFWNKVAELVQN